VTLLLMPVAVYPIWLQTAAAPGVGAYLGAFARLPFWPCGPVWFLWLLLAGDIIAAGLYRLAPRLGEAWVRAAGRGGGRPLRGIAVFLVLSALAYLPLAMLFTPEKWVQWGPFPLQLSRPLHYALYFFAGLGLGAGGVERGLLASDGVLAQRWRLWLLAAVASFAAWLGLTGLVVLHRAPDWLLPLDDLSFVFACAASCGAVLAVFLRYARRSTPVMQSLRTNAYGMYLVHYLFIVWLQYALLPAAWPALPKFAVVFGGTLLMSWALSAALRLLPPAARVIGSGGRALPHAS
jgi:peptidoglycan/LPS O-acetylase OafA/YrhL